MIRDGREGNFEHSVAFYESDEVLVREVSRFLDIDHPGVAIVVATQAHRHAFEDHLSHLATEPQPPHPSVRYISLDAESLLEEFMVDNFPDEDRFSSVMGGLLDSAGTGPIRIFGEMVALLWERGDVAAALKLEKLWNRLAENHRFDLLCAYPTSLLQGSAPIESYLRMCGTHSHLVPFKG